MPSFVGIDLAWKDKNRTGLAAVDADGRLTASGVVRTDDEIAAWLAAHAPYLRVVAVDAPLIVPNVTGQRVAEKLIGQAYGRYGASAYPAYRSNPLFDPPRAEVLAQRFGWETDPAVEPAQTRPLCIEVYPHPALVGLFELPQRVLYKKGADRQAGFLELASHLESVPQLGLGTSTRWSELLATIANPGPGDLTRIEDEIDAILCAHLAWLWDSKREALQVYGSVDAGYIVAPPPPTHPALMTPPPAIASVPAEIVEVWGVEPGTLATRRGTVWAEALRAATADRSVFAPGERLRLEVEFVLPQTRMAQEQWDLDNLLKPTIDALINLLGERAIRSVTVQADDERIDRILASKRTAGPGEKVGARLVLEALR